MCQVETSGNRPNNISQVDSDATDIEDDLPIIPSRPASKRPSNVASEESLIEPPAMSESELESSLDRRDRYRRSLINSMAGKGSLGLLLLLLVKCYV